MRATYVIDKMYLVTCVLRDSESDGARDRQTDRQTRREKEREKERERERMKAALLERETALQQLQQSCNRAAKLARSVMHSLIIKRECYTARESLYTS